MLILETGSGQYEHNLSYGGRADVYNLVRFRSGIIIFAHLCSNNMASKNCRIILHLHLDMNHLQSDVRRKSKMAPRLSLLCGQNADTVLSNCT